VRLEHPAAGAARGRRGAGRVDRRAVVGAAVAGRGALPERGGGPGVGGGQRDVQREHGVRGEGGDGGRALDCVIDTVLPAC